MTPPRSEHERLLVLWMSYRSHGTAVVGTTRCDTAGDVGRSASAPDGQRMLGGSALFFILYSGRDDDYITCCLESNITESKTSA